MSMLNDRRLHDAVWLQGRRSADDDRQIGRWSRCAGDMGRYVPVLQSC